MSNWMELMVVIAEAGITMGFIGALLIILHHVMKKWEMEAVAKTIKETMIPEVEKSMERMTGNIIDVTMDKTTKMIEKMAEEQKKAYDY